MYSRKLLNSIRTTRRRPLELLANQKLYGSTSHLIATLLVLLATLGATTVSWYGARRSVNEAFRKAAEQSVANSEQTIGNRLTLYSVVLSGSGGLFKASESVSLNEWEAYIGSYNLSQQFPGIQTFGYAPYVRQGEEDSARDLLTAVSGDAEITPTSPAGGPSVPVLYLAPLTEARRSIIGFNMYSEERRRAALIAARDSGSPALTTKVELVSDRSAHVNNEEPGLILYNPVFDSSKALDSVQQRREALLGYTYAAIRVNELLKGVYGTEGNPHVGLAVYNKDNKHGNALLYQSDNYQSITDSRNKIVGERNVTIGGSDWALTHVVSADILSQAEKSSPWSALLRGIMLSVALSLLVYYLLTNRARKILRAKHQEVQDAKDDLLSLASHQLRTPATVVKQYVGMLLEGYAGKLSEQQINMLKSAYVSNERQLHIINQILYVARLDAGQIKLHKERINLNKFLTQVVDEHQTLAKENDQVLRLQLPKKTILVRADRQYLHMALDNLVNNALKYTHSRGKITVTLDASYQTAQIKVQDNGMGLSQEEVDSIFDKFTRGDSEAATQVSGSGIGLYLVKQIAELHKGRIRVESNKPRGSVFVFEIPVRIQGRIGL